MSDLVAAHHGHGLWRASRLGDEQRGQRANFCGADALGRHRARELGGGHPRQTRDDLVGLAQGRLHEHLEAREPARERVGPPQIEGKSRGDQQPFGVLGQAQREVVLDHAALAAACGTRLTVAFEGSGGVGALSSWKSS